jgi:hypothetical protein
MESKRYDSVRIINPGVGHLVPLLPTQGFVLVLHGKNCEVEYNSHFFVLYRTDRSDTSATFYFVQKFDLSDYQQHGRVHLGEVSALTDSKFGTLYVFLDCNVRDYKHMMIVNPYMNVVKVDPSTLLEIIIFDSRIVGKWDCTIITGEAGLDYHECDYKICVSDVWKWTDLLEDTSIYEHHYLFRCNVAHQLARGVHSAGKIIFDTEEKDGVYRVVNLNVRVRDGQKQKLLSHGSFPVPTTPISHLVFPQGVSHNGKIRKYVPQSRDSLYRQNITFKAKKDSELHSGKVLFF